MDRDQLGKLYPIKLVPYNPEWRLLFEAEKELLLNLLGRQVALRVEHIGSTAVAGLLAKPTVDILVEIPKGDKTKELIISKMSDDYIYMKEQQNHLMFVKGYTPTGLKKVSYHIHMGPQEQGFLWDRLYFRDYLNRRPDVCAKYEKLKKDLARVYQQDREAYTQGKADFIKRITAIAKEEYLER